MYFLDLLVVDVVSYLAQDSFMGIDHRDMHECMLTMIICVAKRI